MSLLTFSYPCAAREILTLKSGFTIEASSHTINGLALVISVGSGTLEFPSEELAGVQVLPDDIALDKPAAANLPKSSDQLLADAARAQGLPPELVRSVARVESGFNQNATSPKGAVGLMQLMPGTAAELGVASTTAEENALGGAKYLRQLLLKYRGSAALALAAYNAGPGKVAHYNGVPPYAETRRYVVRVLRELANEQAQSKALAFVR